MLFQFSYRSIYGEPSSIFNWLPLVIHSMTAQTLVEKWKCVSGTLPSVHPFDN